MRGPATHFWFTCGLAVVAVGCAHASRAQGAPQPQLDSLSVVAAAVDFYFAGMAGKPRYPMQIDRYEPRPGGGILLRLSPDNTLIKRQAATCASRISTRCVLNRPARSTRSRILITWRWIP